jgi:hypothetical protein
MAARSRWPPLAGERCGKRAQPLLRAALGVREDGLATENVREHVDTWVKHITSAQQLVADRDEGRGLELSDEAVVLLQRRPLGEEVRALRLLRGRRELAKRWQQEGLEDIGVAQPLHTKQFEHIEHARRHVGAQELERLCGTWREEWMRFDEQEARLLKADELACKARRLEVDQFTGSLAAKVGGRRRRGAAGREGFKDGQLAQSLPACWVEHAARHAGVVNVVQVVLGGGELRLGKRMYKGTRTRHRQCGPVQRACARHVGACELVDERCAE